MHKTSVKLDSWTQAGRQAAECALSCLEGRNDPFSRRALCRFIQIMQSLSQRWCDKTSLKKWERNTEVICLAEKMKWRKKDVKKQALLSWEVCRESCRKVFTDESGQSRRPKLVAELGLDNEDHVLFFSTTELCHLPSVLLKKLESLLHQRCALTAGLCRGEGLTKSFIVWPVWTVDRSRDSQQEAGRFSCSIKRHS